MGASLKNTLPSLDFSPTVGPEEDEPKRTGARSSKDTLSSGEQKRRAMSRTMLGMTALGLIGGVVYLGREWDPEELKERKMKIEDAPSTRLARTTQRFTEIFDYFHKPAWPELLPPPYPPPHQKPYTLILELDDLLIGSTWDRQHGWRTAKRPGADYFLGYLSQFYEVVIFTSQSHYTANPILDKLDRYGFFINYRLFREATRLLDGKIVKDLSYLNRDLSKVVCLDTNTEHVSTHPENAIVIPKWEGDPKDTDLVAMIPFLESIAIYKPADVRPILEVYSGKNIPIEYAKKEAEHKAKHIEEWKKASKPVSGGAFGAVFGIGSSQSKSGPPPTYLELKRKEAQLQYLNEQQYIKEHKEEFERLIEQDQQAMAAEVPNTLWEAMGLAPPKKKEEGAEGSSTLTPLGSSSSAPSSPSTPPKA
ncbi:NIF-domain-containing protein [Pluteus cervinus]|uniref:NIF-domain-containing protein n=1 Tax=Pluteus cervinus TaxID=181527 RepID=A0ACD3AT33_9AGAR|nr:NIF-domain-containing protein [Pluteus cervinus]